VKDESVKRTEAQVETLRAQFSKGLPEGLTDAA